MAYCWNCRANDDGGAIEMAEAAPALARALLLAEVGEHVAASHDGNFDIGPVCGVCDGRDDEHVCWFFGKQRHGAGCALDAALTAAGLATPESRDAARKLMKETNQ